MRISTQGRIALASALGTLALIAGGIAWTERVEAEARRQQRAATEVALAVSRLHLATFEYGMDGADKARARWGAE